MFRIYTDGLNVLWQYQEFRTLFQGFRYGLLALIGLVLVIVLLHLFFIFGFNTPLYRRRSPRPGWNKRFFPAAVLLLGLIVGAYAACSWWIARYP